MDEVRDFLENIAVSNSGDTFDWLTALLEALPYAAFIVRPSERGIAWCNQSACDVFGYDRKEMIGRTTRNLHVDDEQFDEFDRRGGPLVQSGQPFKGHFWMRRRDGKVFPTAHLVTPIRELGGIQVVVSFVDDLSALQHGDFEKKYSRLTPRERSIFHWTVNGMTAKEIARQEGISPRTVETHRAHIVSKFEVDSVMQLVSGLVDASSRLGLMTNPG